MSFIKLDRDIQKWRFYNKTNMLLVWIDLLTSASYEDNYFDGRLIEKGQCIIGLKKLSQKLDISMQSLRTCLNRLKSENQITIETTNKYSVITIVNWELYQDKPTYINNQNNTGINNPVTNEQQPSNNPVTTTKEIKELIEVKESLFNSKYTPEKPIEEMTCDELQDEMVRQENLVDEVNLFECFETEFARPITQPELIRLAQWKETHGQALVVYALREALIQSKLKFDYIDGILGNWKKNGVTAEDYEEGKR